MLQSVSLIIYIHYFIYFLHAFLFFYHFIFIPCSEMPQHAILLKCINTKGEIFLLNLLQICK